MGRPIFIPPSPSPTPSPTAPSPSAPTPSQIPSTRTTSRNLSARAANVGVSVERLNVDVAPRPSLTLPPPPLPSNVDRATARRIMRARMAERIQARATRSRIGVTTLRRLRRASNNSDASNDTTNTSADIHARARRYLRAAALEASAETIRRRTGIAVGVGVGVGVSVGAADQQHNNTSNNNASTTARTNTRASPDGGRSHHGIGVRIATATNSPPTTATGQNRNSNSNTDATTTINANPIVPVSIDGNTILNRGENETADAPVTSSVGGGHATRGNATSSSPRNITAANVELMPETDLDTPANAPSVQEMNFSFLIVENRRWREWLLRERGRTQWTIGRSVSNNRSGSGGSINARDRDRRRTSAYAAFCNQYFDVMLRQNDQIYLRLMRIRSRARARAARLNHGTNNNHTNSNDEQRTSNGDTYALGGNTDRNLVDSANRTNTENEISNANATPANVQETQNRTGATISNDGSTNIGRSMHSVAGAAASVAALFEQLADALERDIDGNGNVDANENSQPQERGTDTVTQSSPNSRAEPERSGRTTNNLDSADISPLDAARIMADLRARSVLNEARGVLNREEVDVEVDAENAERVGSSDVDMDEDAVIENGDPNNISIGRLDDNEIFTNAQSIRLRRLQRAFRRVQSLQRQSNALMEIIQETAARSRDAAQEFSRASSTYLRLASRFNQQLQQRQQRQQTEPQQHAGPEAHRQQDENNVQPTESGEADEGPAHREERPQERPEAEGENSVRRRLRLRIAAESRDEPVRVVDGDEEVDRAEEETLFRLLEDDIFRDSFSSRERRPQEGVYPRGTIVAGRTSNVNTQRTGHSHSHSHANVPVGNSGSSRRGSAERADDGSVANPCPEADVVAEAQQA